MDLINTKTAFNIGTRLRKLLKENHNADRADKSSKKLPACDPNAPGRIAFSGWMVPKSGPPKMMHSV